MTLKEIIDGLNELILDRESFIEKDDPDSIFVHDAEVLREAVKILQAVESKEKEQIMSKDEFRQWIYDNYNVPGDNCTLAPAMLDGILDYAEGMEPEEQYSFLCTMFPSLPEHSPPGGILRRRAWKEEKYQAKSDTRFMPNTTAGARTAVSPSPTRKCR